MTLAPQVALKPLFPAREGHLGPLDLDPAHSDEGRILEFKGADEFLNGDLAEIGT